MNPDTRRGSLWIFPLFLVAIAAAGYILWQPITGLFRDAEQARIWISSLGVAAPLVFIGIQVLQVVIFIIPGEVVQVGGGYVFGLVEASLLSTAGILLGALVNFAVGRYWGRPFVERVVSPKSIAKLERSVSAGSQSAGFFLLFLIPGIPKDALCYIAGMSDMRLLPFLLVSSLGRLPGIVGSAFMGSSAYDHRYGSALTMLVVASALFALGFIFRDRITEILHRILKRARQGRNDERQN